MTPSLSTLRSLAEAATPKWETAVWYENDGIEYRATGPACPIENEDDFVPGCAAETQAQRDAAFIAACSPEVILALIGEVEELRKAAR